ncbi:MAG: ATP-binding cassette domain-containing protein [Acidobacteria bacterium]|nr:ATP-binding cassette domain-containing protein [Acidobacteriota bacterium]
MMFLSIRHHQVIHFLTPIAGIAKTQSFSDRITGNVGPISLQIADELAYGLGVLDGGRLQLLQKGDGSVRASIPQDLCDFFQHLVADGSPLHGQAQLHSAFFLQVIPVQFPTLTAGENVELALDLKGVQGREANRRAVALLEQVGMKDKYDVFPADLSGGQKQRVAIARALAGEPNIILADEPTAALDSHSGRTVMEMLRDWAHERGQAVVIVTHDNRIFEFADRIIHKEAEAVLANARAEMRRRQALYRDGVIAREEADRAEREFEVAKSRYEAAVQRHALIDDQAREEDRSKAEAEVALARAELDEARARLEKTIIRSPITGLVLRKHLKTGESITVEAPDMPIVTVADDSIRRVRVDVDETDVSKIRLGQRAYVTADAYGSQQFWGRIVRIGQILGKKNIRTDEPTERVDSKVLETLIELDKGQELPLGLRVDAYILEL